VKGELSGQGFDAVAAGGESVNPLLGEPQIIPFSNHSKMPLPDLKEAEGELYEWETEAGGTYVLSRKK